MLNCPRDHHELTNRLFEDFPVHKCLACFGFWVPKDVVIWLARAENFNSLVQLLQADVFELSSLPQGTLACPTHGTVMHLKSVRGVEVDVCPACRGIWLGRGEFDTAVFRERTGWTEPKEDSFLRLFLDTISYTSDLSRELIRFIRDGLL